MNTNEKYLYIGGTFLFVLAIWYIRRSTTPVINKASSPSADTSNQDYAPYDNADSVDSPDPMPWPDYVPQPQGETKHGGQKGNHMHNLKHTGRELNIISQNIGPAKEADILHLMNSGADILALQEAGDRGHLIGVLRKHGYKVIIPAGKKGASSTPLVYNPKTVKLIKSHTFLTSHSMFGGAGAGPAQVKQKWGVGGIFEQRSTGKRFRAYSTHYVASSYKPLRHHIAMIESNNVVKAISKEKIPTFIIGDFNAGLHSSVIHPLFAHGFTNDEVAGNPLHTHGKSTIDYIWWLKNRGVHFLRHTVVNTSSDHNAVIAQFTI